MKTVLQNVYLRNTEIKYVLSLINNATDPSNPVTCMSFAVTTTDVQTTYFNYAKNTNFLNYLAECCNQSEDIQQSF